MIRGSIATFVGCIVLWVSFFGLPTDSKIFSVMVLNSLVVTVIVFAVGVGFVYMDAITDDIDDEINNPKEKEEVEIKYLGG